MLSSWSLSNHKNNKIMNVSYALLYISYILIVRFHMDCATGCELDKEEALIVDWPAVG